MPETLARVDRVDVPAGADAELIPSLQLTPDVRAERLSDAASQRTIGAALSIVGGVLLAGGAALTIWNEIRRNDLHFDERRAALTRCARMALDPTCYGRRCPRTQIR